MDIEEKIFESARTRINESVNILIVLPKFLTAEVAASGIGLKNFFTNIGKSSTLASSGRIPQTLEFLKGSLVNSVSEQLKNKLVIKLNTTQTKLAELTYDTQDASAVIYLTPKEGEFNESDVSVSKLNQEFDLIITLGTNSLEDLGEFYTQNTEIFYNTPIINIDVSGTNEYFGALNLVDVTSISVAEIIFDLSEQIQTTGIDKNVATAYLSAIIAKTHSFQDVRTTPKAFTVAAKLMDFGGNHQEAVQYIYKTKPLPLLQIWGRALARLKSGEIPGVLFSTLTEQDLEKTDFENSGVSPEDVLHELLDNISGFKVVALLIETGNEINGYIALHPQIDANDFLANIGYSGRVTTSFNFYTLVTFSLEGSLSPEVEQHITDSLKSPNS